MTPIEIARHVWIVETCMSDELAAMTAWASQRWPNVKLPTNPETLAFWIISITIQDNFRK